MAAVLSLVATGALAQVTTTYTYDALGRVKASTAPVGSVTYSYDAADNRIGLVAGFSPIVVNDTADVGAGTSVNIPVLANDSHPKGYALSVTSVAANVNTTNKGTFLVAPGGGSVTYSANSGTVGPDSFSYTVSDGHGGTGLGVVTITIATALQPPIAGNGSATVAYNSVSNIIPLPLSGGAATSFNYVAATTHGSVAPYQGKMYYSPFTDYYGPDSFTYNATNAAGTSNIGTISITVSPPAAPTVAPVSTTTPYNTQKTITLSPSGVWTSLALGNTSPTKGTVSISGTTATYTPNNGSSGPDAFSYRAVGPGGTSADASVSITIGQYIPPPPTAATTDATVPYNAVNYVLPISLGGGAATSVAVTGGPTYGTAYASGLNIYYTPAAGHSTALLEYRATNAGGTSDPAYVHITVTSPPPPPTVATTYATVPYNAVNYVLPISLGGGAATSVAVTGGPTYGTAYASGLNIYYTPASGQSSALLEYRASNDGGTSAPGYIYITVTSPPPPPTVATTDATVPYGAVNYPLPLSFGGGAATSVAVTGGPTYGTAYASGLNIYYTPEAGHSTALLEYRATNAGGTSAPAYVHITVAAPPPPPTVATTYATVPSGAVNYALPLSFGGGAATSVAVTGGPTYGTAFASGLNIYYTPEPGQSSALLEYRATNAGGTSAPAYVWITVAP